MFQAMFYMVAWYMFRRNLETEFDKCNTQRTRIVILIAYLFLVFIPFFGKIKAPMAVDILYQYLLSIVGIVELVSVAKAVSTNRYINYVGQNTLIYFALHGKVYSIIQTILKRFMASIYTAVLNNVVASSVFCLGLSLALSVILILPAYIINRWFPFIVGRSK